MMFELALEIGTDRDVLSLSIQVFGNLLKRCIKALTKYNAIAILLDERVSAEVVLVDRT
jgi:hypothetical protein